MIEGAYTLPNKTTVILSNIPTPPPSSIFYNVSERNGPHFLKYITGDGEFHAFDIPLTHVLFRQVTSADDLILAFLSALLIAILADTIQTVVLRTSKSGTVLAANVVSASLIDEATHLHNIWRYWATLREKLDHKKKKTALISAFAVGLAVLLFGFEMMAVILTQHNVYTSSRFQYNLQGVQPAGNTRGMAMFINRVGLERRCVVPVFQDEIQRREYQISVCFREDETIGEDVTGGEFKVGSWYHEYGSDHEVSWGNNNSRSIGVRPELFSKGDDGESWRITFKNIDNEDFEGAIYKHWRFIYAAIERDCNKAEESERWSSCQQMVSKQSFEHLSSKKEVRNITMYTTRNELTYGIVTGIVSRFRVENFRDDVRKAVNNGMREFVTSGAIEEVTGPTKYEATSDERVVYGLDGLITENGRVAGVWLMIIIVAVMVCLLQTLRIWLKPVTLAFLATGSIVELKFKVNEKVEESIETSGPALGSFEYVSGHDDPESDPSGITEIDL